MDIDTLRSFLAVAKHRSISKAAESLYVTQPAMSQRLRRLEASLGFPLFERDWTGVVLTAQGAYFLPYAAQLVRDLSNASAVLGEAHLPKPRSFAEVVNHPRKVLLGVDSWLPEPSVRAVLQAALARYGIDDFQVITRPATTLIDLLELHQLDGALFYSTGLEYPFRCEAAGSEGMVLIHPVGSALREHSPDGLKELLAGYRLILFDNPVLTHHAAITTELIETYSISRFHIVDDYRTMLSLIRLGGCITVVPAGTLGNALSPLAAELPVTPLHGLLPAINIAVGISDAAGSKGLAEYFPEKVTQLLQNNR